MSELDMRCSLANHPTDDALINCSSLCYPETQTVEAHSISVGNRTVTLIDTPGFDDTRRTDVQVLQEVDRVRFFPQNSAGDHHVGPLVGS